LNAEEFTKFTVLNFGDLQASKAKLLVFK